MKRLLYNDLVEWKESTDRKILIIRGVRQCGKTWLLNDKIIPFEVKSGSSIGARSLTLYRQKYNPSISIKTSMKNVDTKWFN